MANVKTSKIAWKTRTHRVTEETVAQATVGVYRLSAYSVGDWVLSLMAPNGGTVVIVEGEVDASKTLDLMAAAQVACVRALEEHLTNSVDPNMLNENVTK